MQQRPPSEPALWPHQVGLIPPVARSFQHRALADRLHTGINGSGTAVLTGMGGVGKTQLAAEYARTAWERAAETGGLDVLVWVTASARSLIVTEYAQAGVELWRADPSDPEKAARSFLAWLTPKAGAKPCRWLIVLDDVTDPADLRGLWPPASPHGRTLVTSRRRDAALAAHGRHTVEVGLFTKDEALAYLTSSLPGPCESTDELTSLADDLGYLPLALAQAGAYIIDTGETVATYRRLLADRANALSEMAPDALPDDQERPLAAAWSLSIDRADALRPAGLARPLLQLTSLLDANGIPKEVLTSQPTLAYLAAHRTRTGPYQAPAPGQVSPEDAKRALSALHRLSLIDHNSPTAHQAVRVHQLIQRATRDNLTRHQRDQTARSAADALMAAWPAIERDAALAQMLRVNTAALANSTEGALYWPNVHKVLHRVGRSLGESGQASAARDHFQHLAQTTRQDLGEDHPDTLAARHDFAFWRGRAGEAAEAATASAELLEDRVRVLGPDHPDTLDTRHNLARWRGWAGDAVSAATVLEELLEDRVRVLGPDHPDTLGTRHDINFWRAQAGEAAGAATVLEELLDDQVRVLGADHPDTLITRNNLATWRGRAGDAAGAAAALEELLEDRVRVLGVHHPSTLTTRHNLATWRRTAGDAAGAAAALEELLEDRVRVLGPDHPDTLITRHDLAYMRGEAGDAAGAAAGLEELLEDQIRMLRPDHPDTLITRYNLAYWQGKAGDAAEAAAAFEELLDDQVRVLGADHPDTLRTRHNLASWRGKAGDPAGAAAAFEELLDDRVRVLGADHPDTLDIQRHIAYWRGKAQPGPPLPFPFQ
ncbi:ATP-binding protein [Streptomyces sp. MMG1533]|nr:ATP-binding protein [Streptomyces sp. MMG1533]